MAGTTWSRPSSSVLHDKERIKGVLLASAKTTFFAGAELKGVLKLTAADAAEGFARIEALKKSFRRLETMGRPVVALLNGAALGGGWEVALAAHARFALDDRKIQFGTPEVSLGLIPGATGITKTVRLLGLMAAQSLPRRRQALQSAPGGRARHGAGPRRRASRNCARWRWPGSPSNPTPCNPGTARTTRCPAARRPTRRSRWAWSVAPAMLKAKTRGLYPAPQAILETMVEGAMVDYDTATRIESRKLAKIMVGQNAKNMITAFFFNLNAIRSGKSRPGASRSGSRRGSACSAPA